MGENRNFVRFAVGYAQIKKECQGIPFFAGRHEAIATFGRIRPYGLVETFRLTVGRGFISRRMYDIYALLGGRWVIARLCNI